MDQFVAHLGGRRRPASQRLQCMSITSIEVKGRAVGAKTVTITKNEILTGLNKPDEFILAV